MMYIQYLVLTSVPSYVFELILYICTGDFLSSTLVASLLHKSSAIYGYVAAQCSTSAC